jgi:hypothetical protein
MNTLKSNKKSFLIGVLFGFIAPFIGLFAGSQVAPWLGNILMFPFVLIGMLINQPLGTMPTLWLMIGLIASMISWGLIFILFAKLIEGIKNS